MDIRQFQPGDEAAQAAVYNEAARELPRFKPATAVEVQRRTAARDFDPSLRYYAVAGGAVVGYCAASANGRVSFPWCRKGHEGCAGPLFDHALESLRRRGCRTAFAAYRGDWAPVTQFFAARGFRKARDVVSFVQEVVDMPTVPARPSCLVTGLQPSDVPAIHKLCPRAVRVGGPEDLERHLFANPHFPPGSLFALRARAGGEPLAVGLLVTEASFADPAALDAHMPCFWHGAFGNEGMQTKRVKGLFSFLAAEDRNLPLLALDLLGQASVRVQEADDIGCLASQVASDVPHLFGFYQRHFRRQGSFPVYELPLEAGG